MTETQMDLNQPLQPPNEPRNRTTGALVLFLLMAVPMPICLLVYHFVLWSMQESAIESGSVAKLTWAGPIGLLIQGLIMTALVGALWHFTKDDRFKPVYAGWLGAAVMAFPALILRFLGPNNDQLGSILQIIICLLAFGIVARIRNVHLDWKAGNISTAFLLAAFAVGPFVIFGAFGSPTDAILSLLAGLSFGLLAAVLMESTTGNKFLDAFGVGALLALLGSAIGYDGAQLILIAILAAFAFAVATVLPSRVAGFVLTSLIAAAGLIFFDPTELTIVLGDVDPLALKAVGFTVALGLVVGVIGLVIQLVTESGNGSAVKRMFSSIAAFAAWVVVILLFAILGHHGFYGDRLFVILKDQADLSSIRQITDIHQRRTTAYQMLIKEADKSQAELRKTFDTLGVKYTPYYLVNAMEVQGGTLVRLYLLTRPEVDRVIASPRLRPGQPVGALQMTGSDSSVSGDVQWNVSMIGADKVWSEFNARGKGVVVGQSDTGADLSHPAIHDQYRGLNSGDDYNWFDPWGYSKSPTDTEGHGTHTLGTILGKNGIGIAPEATWFACANLRRNLGDPALYLDCMQFMLAPFPVGGNPFKDGDPTKAADVMNNSWGCPEIEGCDPNALIAGAQHLRDAGIFVVVSAGNDGPACSTINAPLSLYDSVFSVGAIDQSGNIAFFSSRGPVTADGSKRMKPDIVAPGVDVNSSLPGGTYGTASGTSMAGPHVVGAVALLWSADPSLIGNIDRTQQILVETAKPYSGDQSQGCFTGDKPNAAYGYGLIDIYAAVKEALGK